MLPLPIIGETVLAIDPGTATGWALHIPNPNGSISSGVHTLPTGKRKGLRWESLRLFLTQTHAADQIDVLAYEESIFKHKKRTAMAAHDHGGMCAMLQWWAHRNGVIVETATPSEIKIHATGNGHAGKQLVIDSMILRGHVISGGDNEADALALLDRTIWRLHSRTRDAA